MRLGVILLLAVGLATASRASAQTVDDGFTFLAVDNHNTTRDGRPVDEGWSLVADFRLFGSIAPRSALRFVIKQGGAELGRSTCQGVQTNSNPEVSTGPATFYVRRCVDREQRILLTGDVSVEVYLLDDATDAETLLRTLAVRVLTATRVGGTGQPVAPEHYVDRNPEVLGAVLHLQNIAADTYMADATGNLPADGSDNQVTLTVNVSPAQNGVSSARGSGSNLRCTVDGTRLELPRDRIEVTQTRQRRVTHSHGTGRESEGETTNVEFAQLFLRLPLSFASSSITRTHTRMREPVRRSPELAFLEDHPGRWECQWRIERDVVRTWRWTVGADGHIVPHAEQGAGLSLGPNAFFVETVLPSAASPVDVRVERDAVLTRAFFGRGWQTDAGRALAGLVADVGEAAPPQPRPATPAPAARGRGRGRARK